MAREAAEAEKHDQTNGDTTTAAHEMYGSTREPIARHATVRFATSTTETAGGGDATSGGQKDGRKGGQGATGEYGDDHDDDDGYIDDTGRMPHRSISTLSAQGRRLRPMSSALSTNGRKSGLRRAVSTMSTASRGRRGRRNNGSNMTGNQVNGGGGGEGTPQRAKSWMPTFLARSRSTAMRRGRVTLARIYPAALAAPDNRTVIRADSVKAERRGRTLFRAFGQAAGARRRSRARAPRRDTFGGSWLRWARVRGSKAKGRDGEDDGNAQGYGNGSGYGHGRQ